MAGRAIALIAVVLVVAGAGLVACAGTEPTSPAAADQVGNLEARLRGVGTGATGKVIVVDDGQGVTLTLDVANLTQGQYRLAFHADPVCNCGSGECSGPVWGPADSPKPPAELIPVIYAGQEGGVSFSARIPGVHVDREPTLRGRSVVLHAGPFVDSPLFGAKNNYIACGVFDKIGPSFLERAVK